MYFVQEVIVLKNERKLVHKIDPENSSKVFLKTMDQTKDFTVVGSSTRTVLLIPSSEIDLICLSSVKSFAEFEFWAKRPYLVAMGEKIVKKF